jgi:hypothetical protein
VSWLARTHAHPMQPPRVHMRLYAAETGTSIYKDGSLTAKKNCGRACSFLRHGLVLLVVGNGIVLETG